MSRLKKRLAILQTVHLVRSTQLQQSEQEAASRYRSLVDSEAALDVAQKRYVSTLTEWEQSRSRNGIVDLVMQGLWAAEADRCSLEVATTDADMRSAESDFTEAQAQWRQALLLDGNARDNVKHAASKWASFVDDQQMQDVTEIRTGRREAR